MVEYLLEAALAEALAPERKEISKGLKARVSGNRSMH